MFETLVFSLNKKPSGSTMIIIKVMKYRVSFLILDGPYVYEWFKSKVVTNFIRDFGKTMLIPKMWK